MLSSWLDLVGVRRCAGCRGADGPLCPACARLLDGAAHEAPVDPRPPGLPPVLAVASYDGPVREAVVAFKDHGAWSLRRPLGAALARSVAAALLRAPDQRRVVLVPAPGSRGSARERDGDHVHELAGEAARLLRGVGVDARVVPALTSVRRRRDQVGLGRDARAANLAASMAPTSAALRLATATPVVLVDDVVTTGSTLGEAARALRSCGVGPVAAAVVAATSRTALPRAGRTAPKSA